MKFNRIWALFLRHIYLYPRSFSRLMELFYWPFLDLVVWGFISLYLMRFGRNMPNFVAFLLGALILWDILFRSQQGISVSFLEDIWARNLLNLFVSPLGAGEYIFALMLFSGAKVLMAGTIMALLAWFLFSFNLFILGLSLVGFILGLVAMGWAIGLLTLSLILRFGQQAEILAWGIAFLFQPVSAVFYPLSVLPNWLQQIARFVPSAYVFEGMREVILNGQVSFRHLFLCFLLDAFYLGLAFLFYRRVFRIVREKGLLAKIGE
ncbi:MAG: ABC transporter permease [Candidatus Aminicenantes bacterium]|nr:ABC transporter permease [Candidatus Aminicenantes bacterium]